MAPKDFNRREFVIGSVSTLALAALASRTAFSQTEAAPRLEWNDFVRTPDYPSFLSAIQKMRANTVSTNRGSWNYWVSSHVRYCRHSTSYFLAWHRGSLYYFEQQLREVSGNPALTVPYWDYYSNSNLPAEFTDPSPGNPLYVTGRKNTNVYSALSLSPFSSTVTNFQRGRTNAFETAVETRPHNPIHNLLGGSMATMYSPKDPIFWLHHANMDRLWASWVAAGGGRQMPADTDTYWSGTFTYNPDLTINRKQTINTAGLGYTYQSLALPTQLPPQAKASPIVRVQMSFAPKRQALRRPPVRQFPLSKARPIGNNRHSIGGAKDVRLDENSVSAQIPVQTPDSESLRSILTSLQTSPLGRAPKSRTPYRSVQLVLDNIRVTPAGQDGGYFYEVYLNLPENRDAASDRERHLVGSFGPFEIDAATHQGSHQGNHHGGHHGNTAQLGFPVTRLLAGMTSGDIRELTVSLVRTSGKNSPEGEAVVIGEVRIELSDDEIE